MSHEMFLAEDFITKTKNIYEAIMIISKRARQIGEAHRKEMDSYLSQVEMMEKFEQGEDEGMIEDAPVQHDPVLQFEKPTILALRQMISEKLEVTKPESEEESESAGGEGEAAIPFPAKIDLFSEEESEEEDEGV